MRPRRQGCHARLVYINVPLSTYCKIRYISKFTAASRGSPGDSTAFLYFLVFLVYAPLQTVLWRRRQCSPPIVSSSQLVMLEPRGSGTKVEKKEPKVRPSVNHVSLLSFSLLLLMRFMIYKCFLCDSTAFLLVSLSYLYQDPTALCFY